MDQLSLLMRWAPMIMLLHLFFLGGVLEELRPSFITIWPMAQSLKSFPLKMFLLPTHQLQELTVYMLPNIPHLLMSAFVMR